MTSFVAWVGVDQRGPSSLYLASDSRISWNTSRGWNAGRKLFACRNCPDVFAYVGDVLFPSLVLGQLAAAIDDGALYSRGADARNRFSSICAAIMEAFEAWPDEYCSPFTVIYGTRQNHGMASEFGLYSIDWSKIHGWSTQTFEMPGVSSSVLVQGSGEESIVKWQTRWNASDQGGTSRAEFSAFCDAIKSRGDVRTGGAPQLVAIYRVGAARTIGTIVGSRAYWLGRAVDVGAVAERSELEWRNSRFERCDVRGSPLPGAQSHHAPLGLGGNNKRR